ncbi:MAG: hypothetical protein Q7S56_01565 [Nanoarchaeota archaeon]|nr:hypothetical protein [Nanoarchaeota archaeon]
MLEREVQSKKRYVWAFVIGTILFLLIIALSYFFAFVRFQSITDLQTSSAYSLFEKKVDYTFFNDNICSAENFRSLTESLAYQGQTLQNLESKFGKDDVGVLERKKFYTVLLLEHLDYVNSYNSRCSPKFDSILFFYSNERNPDDSNDAGKVLDAAYSLDKNILIYSFDSDLNSTLVQKLKDKFNITNVPAVIINENKTLTWPFSVNDIEKYLSNSKI